MDKPVRIAYVANVRMPTEKAHGYQIMKMCEALADEGAEVVLLCPRRRQTNGALADVTDAFAYYGVRPIFSLRYLANADVMRAEPYVPRFLFPLLFHIHSALWGAFALVAARKLVDIVYLRDDVPIAVIARFLRIPFVYEVHRLPAGRIGRFMMRGMKGGSAKLIGALTAHLRERLIAEFAFEAARTVVLPDGVDADMFAGTGFGTAVRRVTGIPAEIPVIGYVGTFTALGYEKGVAVLVRAMAAVRMAYPSALLVCVGGPAELVPQYREVAADAGVADTVRFIGHVPPPEAVKWMRACDVLVIPLPNNEFFAYHASPMKMFEYMASGVPIVASDLPSIREVLSVETALFARPADEISLAEQICRTLADPDAAARRAVAAREAVKRYSWRGRAAAALARMRTLPALF